MILSTEYVMPFGINTGFTLSEIYHYLPQYIEWLIEYQDKFEINPDEFEQLPNPVKYQKEVPFNATAKEKILRAGVRLKHNGSIEKIKASDNLVPFKYHFPEKFKEILRKKKAGIYVIPNWKPLQTIFKFP
jgi:hypothetical protein